MILLVYMFISFVGASNLTNNADCRKRGGFCINPANCFTASNQTLLCDNDQVCCLPKNGHRCVNDVCGGSLHECVHELTYNYRHPLVCNPYERCGLSKQAYCQVCSSIDVRVICCAQESVVTQTGEIVGPNGDIEGIMFNGLELTDDSSRIKLYIAGAAAIISLIAISSIVWIEMRKNRENNKWKRTRAPNLDLI